jgi:hypothetical protein
VSSRVDEAWNKDPLILWALILEDEDSSDAAELGDIAEHLFANAQEAWAENIRLRAQVHSLTGQLNRAQRSLAGALRGPAPA